MAKARLTYPSELKELNKFKKDTVAGLYPSKYPLYKVYGANKSTATVALLDKKKLQMTLYIEKDYTFGINGVLYKNNTIINDSNTFLKSSSFSDVQTSLSNMFLLNGVLDDFDFIYANAGTNPTYGKFITFMLISKVSGDNIKLEMTNIQDPNSINLATTSWIVINGVIGTIFIYAPSIGLDVSQDVSNYEIGIDIYSLITTNAYLTNIFNNNQTKNKIVSISKKGLGTVDFDISNILFSNNEKWTPNVEAFKIRVPKYIEYYQIEAWQKYLDLRDDPNNNYSDIHYSTTTIDNLYCLDATFPLFEDYDNTAFNSITQPYVNGNLDLVVSGTNSNIGYNFNLTKQPRFKELNKSDEILYTQSVVNRPAFVGQNLLDEVQFRFKYLNSDTSGTINLVLQSNETLKTKTLRYINELSFSVDVLKNEFINLAGTNGILWDNIYQIEVNFYNPNYNGSPMTYETQTYFINRTNSTCEDNTSNQIDYTQIRFKNSRGAFDIFEFSSIQEINTDRKYNSIITPHTYLYNQYSEFEKIYNIDYNKTYILKSKILSQIEFNWLEDLIKSREVYIKTNGSLYPIIISNSDYNFKQNQDNIITLTFNYSRPENI